MKLVAVIVSTLIFAVQANDWREDLADAKEQRREVRQDRRDEQLGES